MDADTYCEDSQAEIETRECDLYYLLLRQAHKGLSPRVMAINYSLRCEITCFGKLHDLSPISNTSIMNREEETIPCLLEKFNVSSKCNAYQTQ
jgi:hypothetical protein